MNKTERRLLGALLTLANDEGRVESTLTKIVEKAGYNVTGGAHTYALKMLEIENKITKMGDNLYHVFW